MAVGADDPKTIIGVITTLLVLVWLTLAGRMYIRLVTTRAWGWDDVFIVIAALHVSLCGVATMVGTRYGLTQHIATLTPDEIRSFLISFYCVGAGYVGSAGYVKISLLLQYNRVFAKGSVPYRIGQGLLVFLGLWTFGFVFTNWLGCFPSPSNFWDKQGQGCYGSFSNNISVRNRFIEAHSGVNTCLDFIILALGFYLFKVKDKEGLPLNRKGLIALLSLGGVASAFSVWRFVDVIILFSGTASLDVTFNISGVFLNSTVEVAIGCLCATTPFFWPLIERGLGMIFVQYEFNVSSEDRLQDDQIELTSKGSNKSFGDKGDSHYSDDYVKSQINPFGNQEFRTEASVQRNAPAPATLTGKQHDLKPFEREV